MTIDSVRKTLAGLESGRHGELVRDLLGSAIRYAQLRAEWRLADAAGRRELEESRSRAHAALIDACNILSRAQAASGETNAWRAELGDDRKTIGDFACYLHAVKALEAR